MKLDTLLEYLFLKEAALKPEAPKDAPLGQYLFAPQRKDTPSPKEPNTGGEDALLYNLSSFYSSGGSKNSEAALKQLLDLKNKGLYQKLLKPPSGLAYRFVGNLTPEEASKRYLNRLPVKDITSEPGVAFYAEPIGVIKDPAFKSTYRLSKSKLSSWTIAPTKPEFSSFASSATGKVSVVLVADIDSNNFIMNPKELVKTHKNGVLAKLPIDTIKAEQEVIAYGPIDCLKAAAIYIGPPFMTYEEQNDLVYNITPPIKFGPQKPGVIVPPETFKKTFNFINSLLAKYKDSMSPKLYKIILKSPKYLLLAEYSEKGMKSDGGYSQLYDATNLGINLAYSITAALAANNSLYGPDIQEKLISALNLKIKKSNF